MLKNILPVLCLGFASMAQAVDFKVTFPADSFYDDMRVYVKPMDNPSPQAGVELTDSRGVRTANVADDHTGLYTMYVSNSQAQYSMPVYVAPGTVEVAYEVSITDHKPSTSLSDVANTALREYAAKATDRSMTFNKNLGKLSADEMTSLVTGFMTDADSLAATPGLPKNVADYLKLWGYISASDAVNMETFIAGRTHRSPVVKAADILPPASEKLNNPMAVYFPSSIQTVVQSVNNGTIEESLYNLYATYSDPEIRRKGADILVSQFVDNFNYADGFDSGLSRLEAIVAKYQLPQSIVDTFIARKATIAGAPFPQVELVDKDGNKVDFSKFRGKYVYVDLWASWCGPCVKEVPHLQQLEKDLADGNVEFVSISIDSSKEPWLKKMEQLNMHGNQLWNIDGNLPKLLNVKGIPHFLIYDPEGNLHTYKSLRPSNAQLADFLRSL